MSKKTRFRAYQLGERGSSFSYSVDSNITLIEARYNAVNKRHIWQEMRTIGANQLTCLHITSWDKDHCSSDELREILNDLSPINIEYPGYIPDTDCGRISLNLIQNYCRQYNKTANCFSPEYINGLPSGKARGYNNIVYNPLYRSDNHNDNSVVMLFRKGRFTVLSLGDCENHRIAQSIQNSSMANSETDIMILAHHGADNGFTTDNFVRTIKPKIAICSSNYDNQFEHPRQEIREILYRNDIPLFTTKTGDVIVSCNEDNVAHVYNYITDGNVLSSTYRFVPKCTVPSE